MQSGTYCTPECPFTHDDGFVGQEKKIPVAVVADIVRVLCSSAHESLMALFRKHLFVPTIANTCVIYTTKEPGVGLPGLEQRLSASQHTDKKHNIWNNCFRYSSDKTKGVFSNALQPAPSFQYISSRKMYQGKYMPLWPVK